MKITPHFFQKNKHQVISFDQRCTKHDTSAPHKRGALKKHLNILLPFNLTHMDGN